MTCGLSTTLQDISSSFTSVKDELNKKMIDAAAEANPALGKGVGANISTMKADMETAMADLKAKLDVVIPEVSEQLPNLQTAAEEAAAKLKAAAAEINPETIAALQAEAGAKFEEIRSTWGSTSTPGVSIEKLIGKVEKEFATMDFCTECPNVDLKEIGVDEGTGIPIYETIKKGITANTSIVDTTEPKKAVEKKLIEAVKPLLVAMGIDSVPINTAKSDPNPAPTTAVQTANKPQSVAAAPKPKPKVTGAIQSIGGHQAVIRTECIEFEIMFVPRKDDKGYMWWAPLGYNSQFEYEKAWAISVMNARKQTASRLFYWNRRIETNDSFSRHDPDHVYHAKVAVLQERLTNLNLIKILGGQYTQKSFTTDNHIEWWRFDSPSHWDGHTDCPKPIHGGPGIHPGAAAATDGLDVFGAASKLGYEYIPPPGEPPWEPTKPAWDIATQSWGWFSKTVEKTNVTGLVKKLVG